MKLENVIFCLLVIMGAQQVVADSADSKCQNVARIVKRIEAARENGDKPYDMMAPATQRNLFIQYNDCASELKQTAASLESAADKARDAVTQAQKEFDRQVKTNSGSIDPSFKAKVAQDKAALDQAKLKEAEVDKAKDGNAALLGILDSNVDAVSDPKFTNGVLSATVTAMRVNSWVDKIKAQNADTRAVYKDLNNQMRMNAMSIYMRDKMGQFVNSKLFCEGYNRCRVPQPKKVDPALLNEIFPELQAVPQRQDYYDDLHSSSAAPGAGASSTSH